MSLPRGEITALVGDNGAGKSTLVRCLVGMHRPDAGGGLLDGSRVDFHNPEQARDGRDRDGLPGPRPGRGPHRLRRTFPQP